MTRTRRRSGYTLLEVLLASVIALLLLGALYVTMDVTLLRMDISRDQVGGNDLSRAVVNRMTNDLAGVLGPLPPKSGGSSTTSGSSTPSSGTTPGASSTPGTTPSPTGGSTPTSGTGGGSSAAAGTGSSGAASAGTGSADPASAETTDPAAEEQVVAADIPFQAGVIGTDRQLTVFVSRVPVFLTDPDAAADPEVMLPADLRRVTYYLGTDGGLCRQERPWVTADGVRNSSDPDRTTEEQDVIAPEVVDATFEYLDAGTWVASWDGSQPALDGVSITGPPRAVRVTLTLEFPGRGGVPVQKRVQHVIPIRSANGTYVPPTEGTTTEDPADDPTGGL